MQPLQLEANEQADLTPVCKAGSALVITTPAIGEDYWIFRVRLDHGQAVLGFPKFGTVGVGFALEEDWNTNLPVNCEPEEIYAHIRHNKGPCKARKVVIVEAIRLVVSAGRAYLKATAGRKP